jgi:hypothetical protein
MHVRALYRPRQSPPCARYHRCSRHRAGSLETSTRALAGPTITG